MKHIFISVALILMHPMLMSLFEIGDVTPDFALIWLSILCLQYRRKACMGWGFSLGLLLDLTGGGTLGLNAFSMAIAGYLGSLVSGVPHQGKPFSIRITLMAVLSLQDTLIPLLFSGYGSTSGIGLLLLRYGLPSFMYTILAGLLGQAAYLHFEIHRKDVRA